VTPPGFAHSELADCLLTFGGEGIANLSASRRGQRKVRTLSVVTAAELIEVDLLRQDVTVYRNVAQELLTEGGGAMTFRSDTIIDIPFVRYRGEPLALELEHFVDLVEGRADAEVERAGLLPLHGVAGEVQRVGGGT
jgi:hypothetical protein